MKHSSVNRISKIRIQNLWKRFDIDWQVNDDVNILAGINGSGKTTILKLVLHSLSMGKLFPNVSRMFDLLEIIFDNDETKKIIVDNKDFSKNPKKIIPPDLEQLIEQGYKEEEIVKSIVHSTGYKSFAFEKGFLTIHENMHVNLVSNFDIPIRPNMDIKNDSFTQSELDFQIKELQEIYLNYQIELFKRFHLEHSNKENQNREVDVFFKRNTFINVVDELFAATNKTIDRSENRISFKNWKNEVLSPYQLSAGEKQILIILLYALVQDERNSTFFMDEPEISLHVDWQKVLIKKIRELNPNAQIFIATHSPAIIMEGWLDKVTEIRDIIVRDRIDNE